MKDTPHIDALRAMVAQNGGFSAGNYIINAVQELANRVEELEDPKDKPEPPEEAPIYGDPEGRRLLMDQRDGWRKRAEKAEARLADIRDAARDLAREIDR